MVVEVVGRVHEGLDLEDLAGAVEREGATICDLDSRELLRAPHFELL